MTRSAEISKAPFWRTDVHARRRPHLMARGRIVSALRRFFEAEGFVEVETAALQVSPCAEAHLHGFATEIAAPTGETGRLYLRTSPEFACKKLLAAGETRIFELARVWRNRERGAMHHPEFTLLEWYRAGAPYTQLMEDGARILGLAAEAAGVRRLRFGAVQCDPFAAVERLSIAEAFARVGIDLLATVDRSGGTDRDGLAAGAMRAGVRVADDDAWADIFSRVLVALIEPGLGHGRATMLYDYPAPQAALARLSADDPRVAERFELYACGVELANAFGELTDPIEQRRRLEAEMSEKTRLYGEAYPIDEDFLTALALMPSASGAALGVDRLVMLATGADRIEDVLWAPVPEP